VNWKTTQEAGGGALTLFTSHVFYYLEQLAGPIAALSARLLKSARDSRSGDTRNVLAMYLSSGATASVCVNNQAARGSGHRVECYGSEGMLLLENRTADYIRGFQLWLGKREGELSPIDVPPLADQPADGRVPAVACLMRRFTDWVLTGRAAKPDFSDGIHVQGLIESARRSDERGTWEVV
jgi:predicted dehydrogenase